MIQIRGNDIDEEKILGVKIIKDSSELEKQTYYILELLMKNDDGSIEEKDIVFGNEGGIKTVYNRIQTHLENKHTREKEKVEVDPKEI